jgi:hypothetical protein
MPLSIPWHKLKQKGKTVTHSQKSHRLSYRRKSVSITIGKYWIQPYQSLPCTRYGGIRKLRRNSDVRCE